MTLLQRGQPPLVARLNQALHQIRCTGEVNSQPPARGFHSERDRQMSLAGAARNRHILLSFHVRPSFTIGGIRSVGAFS
jgi:hypothetical protein